MTLADAIRIGSEHTDQAFAWRTGENVCALGAAILTAIAFDNAVGG